METCNKLQSFQELEINIYIHDNKFCEINKPVRIKAEDNNVEQFESFNKPNQF